MIFRVAFNPEVFMAFHISLDEIAQKFGDIFALNDTTAKWS